MKYLLIFVSVTSLIFSTTFGINPFRLQMVSQADNGAYDFAYDTGDGAYHIQSRDNRGTVTGKFAYVDPEGQLREIDYKADDNGFHPSGDIHPKRSTIKSDSYTKLPTFESNKTNRQVSFPSSQVPHSQLLAAPEGLDPVNKYLRPDLAGFVGPLRLRSNENLDTFIPEHVVGPVPSSKMDVDSLAVNSPPIAAKPFFPIAALLSTGTLPDIKDDVSLKLTGDENKSVLTRRPQRGEFDEKSSLITGLLANSGDRKVVRNIQYFENPRPLRLVQPPTNQNSRLNRAHFNRFSPVQEFLNQHKTIDESAEFESTDSELRYSQEQQTEPNSNVNGLLNVENDKTKFISEDQSERLLNSLTKLIFVMSVDDLVERLESLADKHSTDSSPVRPVSAVEFDEPLRQEIQQIVMSLEKLLSKTSLNSTTVTDKFEHNSTNSNTNSFSDDASLKVHQTPILGSPLYTPVEGIREVNGEKLLHRTYVPFTRRYGYVYTQRAE